MTQLLNDPAFQKSLMALAAFLCTQLFILFIWLIKQVWSDLKAKGDKYQAHMDQQIKATQENTTALTKLSVQFEMAIKQVDKIPQIEKDIAGLGAKLRNSKQE